MTSAARAPHRRVACVWWDERVAVDTPPLPRTPLVIDTDPGIDDALALLLALASPEVDLRLVTTVHGNVDLDQTTDNALRVLHLAGRSDVPVAAGAAGAPGDPPAGGARPRPGAGGPRRRRRPPAAAAGGPPPGGR